MGWSPRTGRRARGALAGLLVAVCVPVGGKGLATQAAAVPDRELLARIWNGVDQAARSAGTACGRIIETRTSPLFTRARVLGGTFCAAGTAAFRLDYSEPDVLRIIYNDGILNVTTDNGRHTEVLEIGSQVRRTQQYFSGAHAIDNLERDFKVTAVEDEASYTLVFVPASRRFATRIRELKVTVGHADFRLRRLEIRGTNGAESVFGVRIDRVNVTLDPGTFKVYRPSVSREPFGYDGH